MYTPEFRAWLVDDQRMIPNHQITLTAGVVFEHVAGTIPPVRRDDAVVMHATGISDKHGTPIFPGDQLKWNEAEWGAPFTEVVEWDYQQFSSRANDWPQFVEIVGNIYENKECSPMNPEHELYTAADFQHMNGQEYEDNPIVSFVLDGGLSICKCCGEAEAGLDNPCKPKSLPAQESDAETHYEIERSKPREF